MGDLAEIFRDMSQDYAAVRGQRALKARATYPHARELAYQHGIDLAWCSNHHYQLVVGSAIYDLYPSTQRITIDRHHRGPRLDVPRPWGLLCVVRAAVKMKQEGEPKS